MQPGTPYSVVSSLERPRPVSKRDLVHLSRQLERAAFLEPPHAVAAALQDQRFLTARTRDTYRRLAAAGTPVTLYARGLPSWLAPGVHGVDLDEDDPLVDEWVVVLASPRHPTVLAAIDLKHPRTADLDRTFEHAVSHDEQIVRQCLALLTPG